MHMYENKCKKNYCFPLDLSPHTTHSIFCPLSAELGEAAEEAEEVGWGGCVVCPKPGSPLEPFISSLGLVGVMDESPFEG